MDLNLTSEETQFRDELRAWLGTHVPRNWEHRRDESVQAHFAFLTAWQRTLYEGGWAGISWPREFGGRGASLMQQVIFWQEMASASAPPMANVIGLGMVGPTIIAFGTEAQKTRFLRKILSAEEIWCQGFSEPNAGSDLAALQSEARLDGDHFVVNGQKVWCSNGRISDWGICMARTDHDAPPHKGISFFLVDMHAAGVDVRPLRQMTGEAEFTEVFFRDVRVPVENVVGKVNQGWDVSIGTLMHERGTLGAGMQVTYQRNIERLIELSRTIQRGGRPASEDPVIRQRLAQCYAEVQIMRANQMRAFSRISTTGVPGPEGSIQKIFWSELNQRLQQIAQELLGPYGQLEGDDPHAVDHGAWSYGYLRARGNTIEAGTSEIQRNIIGHFVLGLPRSY